jgi:hypothetical protein
MKPEPAQTPARRPLPRERIRRNRVGQGRVKGSFKGGYLRHCGKSSAHRIYSCDGGGIVQRREISEFGNLVTNRPVYDDYVSKAYATVHHAMANRVDRLHLIECRRDFTLVSAQFAALPAGVALLPNRFGLHVQGDPLQATGARVQD